MSDPGRLGRILNGERPCQLLVAGKAHPRDDEGKRVLQRLYGCRHEIGAGRLIFLEDYDLAVARELVAGCDIWINLPRPPLEASGTSGMKAAFNGALQLSVLDGWWAEGFTGGNGWGIESEAGADPAAADAADAGRLYAILEDEAVPLYYDRDEAGVPHRWCDLVKESIVSCAPRFTATRMLQDYLEHDLDENGVVRLSGDALISDAESVFFADNPWASLDVPVRFAHAEWSSGAGTPPASR